MLDHFSRLKTLENKIDEMFIRGPLVIGMKFNDDENEEEEDEELEKYKIEFLFDYEEDKIIVFDFDKKLDPQEMKKLSLDFIYQPSLG